jgi:hypothetical protein
MFGGRRPSLRDAAISTSVTWPSENPSQRRQKKEAIASAAETIESFEVIFDKAECVEFYPIRIIDQ